MPNDVSNKCSKCQFEEPCIVSYTKLKEYGRSIVNRAYFQNSKILKSSNMIFDLFKNKGSSGTRESKRLFDKDSTSLQDFRCMGA